jgi:GNAT superfamily N-acetyltransferase
LRIRIATHADAELGIDILRRSIRELCRMDHGGNDTVIAAWLSNKTPAMWHEWVDRDDATLYVAVEFDQILGVAMVAHDGEVMLNYVSPDARWCGVSKALLAQMEAAARAAGLTHCTLSSTKTAHGFYEAAGYRPDTSVVDGCDRLMKNI